MRIAGYSPIWGGELLEAPAGAGLRVMLPAYAQVSLAPSAAARLFTTVTGSTGVAARRALMAALERGEMLVRLQPDVGAYVEALGLLFTAFNGESFRIGLEGGRVVIDGDRTRGAVVSNWSAVIPAAFVEAVWPAVQAGAPLAGRRLKIRPVGLNANLVVRSRSTREVQFQVTDEHDRPVPDVLVIITLGRSGGQSIGTLGGTANNFAVRVMTNARGIAHTTFTAEQMGVAPINATIADTNISAAGTVTATSAASFTAASTMIPVLVTIGSIAAGAAVTIHNKVTDDSRKQPLTPLGPPVVRP